MFTIKELQNAAEQVVNDIPEPAPYRYVAIRVLAELPVHPSEWEPALQLVTGYVRMYHSKALAPID